MSNKQIEAMKLTDTAGEVEQPRGEATLAQQHVSVTDEFVDAYCKTWQQSFTADNPYHTVKMTEEDRKHIEAGLKAALAEQSRAVGTLARGWVGLMDEEFQWIYDHGRTPAGMMEMVEAKLKEKNT